ncbi:MAG: hypothetical protein ACLFTK_04330 [Anaerolineales bacterium]
MTIPENALILDAGNSIIKAKTDTHEVSFPHALRRLTETEYQNILSRSGFSGPPHDYLVINGEPYVVGRSAERHGTLTGRTGAARYTADYYGVFVAAALARTIGMRCPGGSEKCEVAVFGSHAPGDVAYREELMRAAVSEWHVRMGNHEQCFRVTYSNTFDEPVGGLMNVLLTEDGLYYRRTDVRDGRSLVIDIGGHTTDWLAVNPGGDIDYSLSESVTLGIQDVMRDFERSFRANNREATKDISQLPPDRVRDAIRTGVFNGGGRQYPCEQEVNEATNVLLNRIRDTFQQHAGGPLPWDSIILTGGGSAMLYGHLQPLLGHQRVLLSDNSHENHLANVRGGLKLWKLYKAHGML